MVTDHEEGRTLEAEVEEVGPLPEERLRPILATLTDAAATLTDAAATLHDAGLLHRSIKPTKVVIRPDGTPALLAPGISSRRGAAGRDALDTQPAVLTPRFTPIEQYDANGRHGPWTDIYALGAVAYWALSGVTPDDVTDRLPEDRLVPLAEVAPEPVSAELAAAVMAALAVRGADRPQSLEAWRSMLERPRRRWWQR